MANRILITKEGKRYFVKDISKDYHMEYGFISKADLKKKQGQVKTNTGTELGIFEPSFSDLYRKIKRGPQIIARKDIGLIMAETGIGKNSIILDSGAGSGALCCYLANYAKKVTAYEIREDFLNISKYNAEFLGLKNLTIKNKDIYQGIDEKNLDLITLDLPEPWNVVEHASKALKSGGYLVSYSPTIPQAMDFANAILERKDFAIIKTSEVIEREWEMEGRKVRPKSRMIGHTGFLTFARKI